MEITIQYIFSQIAIIFVFIFLILTYCVKNRKIILGLSLGSNLLNALAFILLGAYTSAAMCGISIFRDIVFTIDQKINGKSDKTTKKDVLLLLLLYGISISAIIITFKGFLTLLYTVASMLYTYSIWQKNNKVYRFMGMPVSLISILDSVYIKSIFGVILQAIVFITSTIGFFSHNRKQKYIAKGTDNNMEYQSL